MILLVSGATATIRGLPADAPVGHLLAPSGGPSVAAAMATGRPVAADNRCGPRLDGTPGQLDPRAYVAMLRALSVYADRVLWATAPDVVGDARATLRRWRRWRPLLARLGLRAAYVAQDGQETLPPPWEELDALFIGGSTRWKEGPHAARVVVEAKARGKWVHVGRVNSERRRRPFDALGADSFDGTQFSMFPDTYIPRWAGLLTYKQHGIPEALC